MNQSLVYLQEKQSRSFILRHVKPVLVCLQRFFDTAIDYGLASGTSEKEVPEIMKEVEDRMRRDSNYKLSKAAENDITKPENSFYQLQKSQNTIP